MIDVAAIAQAVEIAKEIGSSAKELLPEFSKELSPNTNSLEQANMPIKNYTDYLHKDDITANEMITKEVPEAEKYITIDEALKDVSPEERKIYEEAGLEKGEINEREALQRTDIDPDARDQFGQTNLDRMKDGLPPLVDGEPIELHHIGQKMNSPLAELKPDEHRGKGNDGILHEKGKETEIDRTEFSKERKEYWMSRAEQIESGRS